MIIVAGSSHPILAKAIANKLTIPFIQADVRRFEDQELCIQVTGELYERDVVIVQSTCKPANDHLMELLLLIDTAKRAGARRIITIIPYFGYARQDRPSTRYSPLSASLVATLIESAGVHRVLTLDLHSKQTEGFFKVGVQNLSPLYLFQDLFPNAREKGYMVVSPDVGGLLRAKALSAIIDTDLAVVNKTRTAPGECEMSEVIGTISGKKCILIDDIIDSGGTLTKAAALLVEKGAKSVTACVTHAVMSRNCKDLVEKSPIDTFYITNSIHHDHLPKNCQCLPIEGLFVNALKRFLKE